VKRLFKDALDVPPADREELLRQACADDGALLREVESLLDSFERAPAQFLHGSARLDLDESLPDELPLPALVGPCRPLEHLDRPALSETWLAELVLDRPWARRGRRVELKVVRAGPGRTMAVRRLQREARLGMEIRHAALPHAWEIGSEGDGEEAVDYLILEHVPGRSVTELTAQLGQVPEPLLREIALHVADALAVIHARGIVHRGVRGDCVVLGESSRLVMGSFESAFVIGEARITGSHDIVVPARYAAPELLEGGEPTPAADVYSLGVLLHEAATGAPAFPGTDIVSILRAQLARRLPRLRDVVPETSAELDGLVSSMLSPEPADRPAAGQDIASRLANA
jgi:serine/threonine protein kinase